MDSLFRYIMESSIDDYSTLENPDEYVSEAALQLYPEGTVIYGYYPYKSTIIKEHSPYPITSNHYGVVIFDSYYGTIVVKCTSKVNKYKHKPLTYVIPEWKNKGFTKPTCVIGISLYQLSQIEDIRPVGKVDSIDIKKIHAIVSKYLGRRFEIFEYLMNWLKWRNVRSTIPDDGVSNNNNRLQTVKDINRTNTANCVDISTMVHHVAGVMKVEHYIVWVRFVNATRTGAYGHLFVIYRYKNGLWKIFRYSGGVGDIITCGPTIESALSIEVDELLPHFTEEFGCRPSVEYILIGKEQFHIWDKLVREREIQQTLLNVISSSNDWVEFKK